MNQWNSIYTLLPTNGETVWVRPSGFFDDPILAQWNGVTSIFTSVDTGIIIPAWNVYRWKSQ